MSPASHQNHTQVQALSWRLRLVDSPAKLGMALFLGLPPCSRSLSWFSLQRCAIWSSTGRLWWSTKTRTIEVQYQQCNIKSTLTNSQRYWEKGEIAWSLNSLNKMMLQGLNLSKTSLWVTITTSRKRTFRLTRLQSDLTITKVSIRDQDTSNKQITTFSSQFTTKIPSITSSRHNTSNKLNLSQLLSKWAIIRITITTQAILVTSEVLFL